ncbi:MAG: hypothetical protein AAB427_11145 [Chloroflexota bacterium]
MNFSPAPSYLRVSVIIASLGGIIAACGDPTASTQIANDVFHADFSEDDGLWETFNDNQTSAVIGDGHLTLGVKSPSTVGISLAAINLTDFDLTVTTTQTDGDLANGYGIIFRYIDERNFYRFDISGDTMWAVSRRSDDQWLPLSDLASSAAIQPGLTTNIIRVVARGSRFEFYANGVLLGRLTDSNLPVGRIGVFASTFDGVSTHVNFDDVSIVKP